MKRFRSCPIKFTSNNTNNIINIIIENKKKCYLWIKHHKKALFLTKNLLIRKRIERDCNLKTIRDLNKRRERIIFKILFTFIILTIIIIILDKFYQGKKEGD